MKLKDFKPTYNLLEMIEANRDGISFRLIGLTKIADAKEKYGEREVLSVQDFHDTKSTSVIIERNRNKYTA